VPGLPAERRCAISPYEPLTSWVAARGGWRLARAPGPRDQLIRWPHDAAPERLEEVLYARLSRRCRARYGSVVASLLISLVLPFLVRLVVEWWLSRRAHKYLMEVWGRAASNTSVPPPQAEA